uniref:Ribosomal RNA small subunit methyltransferase E n=1 Tax=Candidatus Kentrum sp. FM TaxID=2126340 RepID=A0A450U009_9GAMM|nr:MAG: 16S rRNA (uracil1498-N3)-methyltransferase [Candidatus Kentron sp. FM]VFJ75650.1 MAG: 16S rRNA (uracil1498-N3)-methyltransferase [Candidatus Kentron sp. FM]VFK23804.1 MAG: 16S rRNA (uracil1498-N3)-methyltransferase [Candidatus Kentron sp. FM]
MPTTRIYLDTPLDPDAVLNLPAAPARHVTRVLRLRIGMPLVLFNGRGGEFDAEIIQVRGQTVSVRIGQYRQSDRELPLTLCLVQGISRGERMDWVIQKAVELGVSRIEPVFTLRSVVQLNTQRAIRRLQHWRAIAIRACEQCGRNRIPELTNPLPLTKWIASRYERRGQPFPQSPVLAGCEPEGNLPKDSVIREPAAHGERPYAQGNDDLSILRVTNASLPGSFLLLQPGAKKRFADIRHTDGPITLLVGPEGGLTPEETERVMAIGFIPVSLGPRTLRTETAAIAGLTAIDLCWGDF